jgi:hypothetical protein
MTGNITPFRPPSANVAAPQLQKKLGAHLLELCANTYQVEGFRYVAFIQLLPVVGTSLATQHVELEGLS